MRQQRTTFILTTFSSIATLLKNQILLNDPDGIQILLKSE